MAAAGSSLSAMRAMLDAAKSLTWVEIQFCQDSSVRAPVMLISDQSVAITLYTDLKIGYHLNSLMEKNAIEAFSELIAIADTLNGPGGCPWDHKQTFTSLSRYVLEEAHEVVDAVHHSGDDHLLEELGDLFYTVVFYAKVAERENRFQLSQIIEALCKKLVRRHPHVFGEITITEEDEIVTLWEQIKKQEKENRPSSGPFDDIPKNLPALSRAAKVIKRIRKKKPDLLPKNSSTDLGNQFIDLISRCQEAGHDPETLLRQTLADYEKRFKTSS